MRMRVRHISLLAALAVLTGCAAPEPAPPVTDANLFVVGVGWHTQIYLPEKDLAGRLRALAAPGARYVGFGFAQRAYAMPRSHAASAYVLGFFRSLAPSRAILIVTWLRAVPTLAWPTGDVVGLRIGERAQAGLERALWSAFVHRNEKPIRLESGFYPGSAFYAATQRYDLLFTCNTWTDEMLRAAGLPVSKSALFASTTMDQVRALARARSGP